MKKKLKAAILAGMSFFTQQQDVESNMNGNNYNQNMSSYEEQQVITGALIHQKLLSKQVLNSNEISYLISLLEKIEEKSPRGSNENNLTQVEKDIRYLSSSIIRERTLNQLSSELNKFIRDNMKNSSSKFLNNIRNKNEAVFKHENVPAIDFTNINASLSELIVKTSKKYDVNPRLVAAICTIENNFGNQRVSSANARGMCQTKVPLVKHYYSNYDSLSEADKNWAHFITTFKYLEELKKKYSLSIRYKDASTYNNIDFLLAGLFYYNGETRVLTRENIIYQKDSKEYLLRLLDSFNYPIFKLSEKNYY